MIDRRADVDPVITDDSVTTTVGRSDVDVADGQDLRVTCTASGTPTPEIDWEKDGIRVRSTGKVKVDAAGTLNVDNFEGQDAGSYTCIATNAQGTDRQTISVSRASKQSDLECVLCTVCILMS